MILVAHARIDFRRDRRHVVDRADLQLGGDVVRFDRVAESPTS